VQTSKSHGMGREVTARRREMTILVWRPPPAPNGLEMSRPASQGSYRAKLNTRLAGSVEDPRSEAGGSSELLGGGTAGLRGECVQEFVSVDRRLGEDRAKS